MEGRAISLTGYVAHLGLLVDLALSLLQRWTKSNSQTAVEMNHGPKS